MATQKLSNRKQLFATLIATQNLSPYQAALKANYSETTARVKSYGWLDEVSVKEAIDAEKRNLAKSGALPTPEQIITELWSLAQNADTDAARVSSLRTLADIHGQLGGGKAEMPPAVADLLEALGRGLSQSAGKQLPHTVTARMIPEVTDRESEPTE